MSFTPTRRTVLAGLGALIVCVRLPTPAWAGSGAGAALNAFVRIDPDDTVTILIPSSEMGQGINTSLPQLVAEELDVAWEKIRVEHAPEDEAYRLKLAPGYVIMVTGGSNSVKYWWTPLQTAGAAAREMLIAAAAARWGVDPEQCSTEDGVVRSGENSARYGELVGEAAGQKAPKKPALRGRRAVIGHDKPRLDLLDKVTGACEFGMDVKIPDMVQACAIASPVFGGRVGAVDDAATRAIPGVLDVLVFEDFVAVVAETWWPARQGIRALTITWDDGDHAQLDSDTISERLHAGLDDGVKANRGHCHGKATKRLKDGADLEVTYEVPYLDHQTMEPMNATVRLTEDRCEIWAGTQNQTIVRQDAEAITGIPLENIDVHTTYLGGGFGRRGNNDFVQQALKIATRVARPVQLIWTREEGTRHGWYRPAFVARLRAKGGESRPGAFHLRIAGPNILNRYLQGPLTKLAMFTHFPMEGLIETCPYGFDHVLIEHAAVEFAVPIGFWRSVGHSHNAFFMESMIDELAHIMGVDEVELRRELITEEHPRFRRVLDTVVEAAGSPPEGRFHGVALHESFGSICGQVAEVSVDGGLRVHKVYAAIDCGQVVNPDIARAQIMSGAIYGLSAALGEKLTLKRGRIEQGNFHDYPILRMVDAPEVETHIVETPEAPIGGIGEIGTPPVAPAVCNAIFKATGQRIRRLPILDELELS